jgi:xanthine/uracil/vitamin C permease (AzgA family)
VIKLLRGRVRDVQPMMYAAAAMFAAYFWLS